MAQNPEKLKDWIGQREADIDYVTVPSAHRFATTAGLR